MRGGHIALQSGNTSSWSSVGNSSDVSVRGGTVDGQTSLTLSSLTVNAGQALTIDSGLTLAANGQRITIYGDLHADGVTFDDVDFYYRNAQGDEIVYVASGEGTLETLFGELAFSAGDYLVVPRGILHRLVLDSQALLLVIESAGLVRTPMESHKASRRLNRATESSSLARTHRS